MRGHAPPLFNLQIKLNCVNHRRFTCITFISPCINTMCMCFTTPIRHIRLAADPDHQHLTLPIQLIIPWFMTTPSYLPSPISLYLCCIYKAVLISSSYVRVKSIFVQFPCDENNGVGVDKTRKLFIMKQGKARKLLSHHYVQPSIPLTKHVRMLFNTINELIISETGRDDALPYQFMLNFPQIIN